MHPIRLRKRSQHKEELHNVSAKSTALDKRDWPLRVAEPLSLREHNGMSA